jgi:hypothetical protein
MLTVKLLAIELGALLIYAGVRGLSIQRLLLGDNKTAQPNQGLAR